MGSLVVFTLMIGSLRAQELAAVGGPCATIAKDRKDGLAASGGQTTSACRDQIKTSFDACVKDPEVTDDEKKAAFSYSDVQIGGPSLYQKQTAAWTEGYGRYTSAAELCRGEKTKITDACEKSTSALKPTAATNAQAQAQVDATAKAQAAATQTVDNQIVCLQSQADALSAAVQKLQENSIQETQDGDVTATNGVNVTKTDPTAPDTPVNQPKPLSQIHQSPETQDLVAAGVGTIPVVGPVAGLAYAGKTGDWAGGTQTLFGVADSLAIVGGEGVLASGVEIAGGPIGLFAVTVGAPNSSQNACADTNKTYDPAAATRGGCSGIPSVSSSTLDSTVFTLSGP
jgi:hypothetical protein